MQEYKELLDLAYFAPMAQEKPLSLLFIGDPGSGKSHLLTNYRASNCLYLSDTTAAGLEQVLSKFDAEPELAYVVIPDLIVTLTRRGKRLTSFLNVALEEGVGAILRQDVSWQTKQKSGGANIGVIAAITTNEYKANYSMLRSTGFFSRTLMINFDPDTDDIAKSLARGEEQIGYETQVPKFTERQHVDVPDAAADEIFLFAARWATEEGEHPLRKVNVVRRMSRARAYMRWMDDEEADTKQPQVILEDVKHVEQLIKKVRLKWTQPGKLPQQAQVEF